MKHYTKGELELYRHHETSVLTKLQIGIHLRQCDRCAELLKELEAEDALVAELRESIHQYTEIANVQPRPSTKG